MHKIVVTLLAVAFVGIVGSRIPAEENTDAVVQGKVLFDFEDPTQAASWKMWQFPKPEKGRAPKPEPDAKVEV